MLFSSCIQFLGLNKESVLSQQEQCKHLLVTKETTNL
jgi:hypothetical protein